MKTLRQRVTLKNKISFFALLLFLSFLSSLFCEVNSDIAKLYLSAADSFFKENKTEETEVFLNKSLLYDESISDVYYIKALIKIDINTELTEVISLLKKAITYRNWTIYRENNAFYFLGKIYSRTRDFDRALSALYVVKDEYIDNSDYLDAYSLSLINKGSFNEARDLLKYAVGKYPENSKFIKRLASLDISYRDDLLSKILDLNQLYKYESEILIELARLTEDKGVKIELVSLLDEMNFDSPELIIEKAGISGNVINDDIDAFFNLEGFSNFRNIRKILSMIKDNNVKKYLIDKFKTYSGYIKDDYDSDGFYEKIMYVNNGITEWYSEDNNQDNINDIFSGFQDGKPVFINIEDEMLAAYYDYPFIKTIILFGNNFNEIYNFKDKKVYFDILDFSSPVSNPVIKGDYAAIFSTIKNKAENYRKSSKDDNLSVVIEYFKTEKIKNFETYDSITSVIRRGTIKDDNIIFSIADMKNNNLFETKEQYKDGKLESINYDGNNNGVYEFRIEKEIKYWDINEDGIFDIKEWKDGSGMRYTEFSTGLDGIFNFAARYIGSSVVDVKKDGKWNSVTYDKERNIYWLGKKCTNMPDQLNIETEGFINCADIMVYVIKIGKNYFAEVID